MNTLAAILADGLKDGFFEVHAENYMGAGGPPHRALAAIRENYPLSIHGVCMSIGGPGALDATHLARFRDLVTRYEPTLVSEHLAWSSHGGKFFNDLLPLPYTKETLEKVCEHIDQVQEAIKRPILLENPSTYVAFASSTMSETDFIRAVVNVPAAVCCWTSITFLFRQPITAFPPRRTLPDSRLNRWVRYISPDIASNVTTKTNCCSSIATTVPSPILSGIFIGMSYRVLARGRR